MYTVPASTGSAAYSASVRLSLRLAGQPRVLAQVGPTWVSFDEPVVLESKFATLAIEIDGHTDLTEIELDEPRTLATQFSYSLRG
jgi:hypothetical protein